MIRSKQFQLPLGGKMFPLSLDNAHVVISRAIERGDVAYNDSFFKSAVFTTVEVAGVVTTGTMLGDPEHFVDDMWLFRFIGMFAARLIEVSVVLDLSEDLDSPLAIFIDVQCRRAQ